MITCSPIFNLKKHACIIMSIGLISSYPDLFPSEAGHFQITALFFIRKEKK